MSANLDYSVVIPCYNAGELIHRAIDSILRQRLPAREVIVVDDGSTDGTSERIEQRWGNRVCCVRQANAGPSAARNRGVSQASAPWVAFLDADDVWVEEKLVRQATLIEREPALVLVASDCLVHEGDGSAEVEHCLPRNLDRRSVLEALRVKTTITLSTVVVRRDVFLDLGGFNSSLICGEDREFWTRIAARHPIGGVHEFLVHKYDQEGSLSRQPERTIKDGLVVNRYVDSVLRQEPHLGLWDRWTGLRRADAELFWGVAWLYQRQHRKPEALRALFRSLGLWPFDSPRRMWWRFSALFRLLAGRA